ncbi:unnamed protein product [Rotaria magnacalcarata]|uniref:6-phosphofructo-2-kinase domain-containing protein n=1 Tax=Rotaria magnacalcarata TaxID=392030 RepID=A0A8S2T8K4_9BILA|nr:unnamed protein product [Rotaria magnacalcarata]
MQEEPTTTDDTEDASKFDLNYWRKRRSFLDPDNPIMNRRRLSQACRDRLVRTPTIIAMAGLPARGKTYISRKLARYLQWIGIKTKEIIEANIKEVKLKSPDYKDVAQEEAVADFLLRIEQYEKRYEPIDDKTDENLFSFIKIFNCGERFLVHKIGGHIQSRVVYFLMNIHVTPRTIYLTRHGESELNVQQRIGGDPPLSINGKAYADALANYVAHENIPDLIVWTSQMQRTIQSAAKINAPKEQWKALNEINAGICEGLTYVEIATRYPEEFSARDQAKYHYRYPGGEVI